MLHLYSLRPNLRSLFYIFLIFILSNVYLLIYALNFYFREELLLFLRWATLDLTPLEILLVEMKNMTMVKKLELRLALSRAL